MQWFKGILQTHQQNLAFLGEQLGFIVTEVGHVVERLLPLDGFQAQLGNCLGQIYGQLAENHGVVNETAQRAVQLQAAQAHAQHDAFEREEVQDQRLSRLERELRVTQQAVQGLGKKVPDLGGVIEDLRRAMLAQFAAHPQFLSPR